MASRSMAAPRAPAAAWLPAFALLAFAGVLIWRSQELLHTWLLLVAYPFGSDYGEGIVWQQMRNMLRGAAYGPIAAYPAIVYHYPPVYHLVAGAIAMLLGTDQLATGRAVSLASALGSAVLVGRLAIDGSALAGGRRAALACGGLAALVFLNCEPVFEWAPLMRVDMLACLLSLAGLAFAVKAVERPGLVHPAAICFVLAVYTKQVSVAAPAAAIVGLWLVRPALAVRCLASCLLLGGGALALLCWLTGGGFVRHIVLYNVNRLHPEMISALVYPVRVHLGFLAVAGMGAWSTIGRVRRGWAARTAEARDHAPGLILLLYLLFKTAMLAMIVKSGANLNYCIEWFCAVALFVGIAVRAPLATAFAGVRGGAAPAAEPLEQRARYLIHRHCEERSDEAIQRLRARGSGLLRSARNDDPDLPQPSLVAAAVFAALLIQALDLPRWRVTSRDAIDQAAAMKPLVAMIAASPKPVIADEMTLLIRACRDVAWEPAIAAELGSLGRYDQAGFVQLIRRHRFGFFVTEGDRGMEIYDGRYNPPVADAIARFYPRERMVDGYTVHLPA